jgi:hypothetical protein
MQNMSPSVFREKGYRFYFLSNEEDRIHIHVTCESGEAKFWLEPIVSLATYHKLNPKKLIEIQGIVEEHRDEIVRNWRRHFGKRWEYYTFWHLAFCQGKGIFSQLQGLSLLQRSNPKINTGCSIASRLSLILAGIGRGLGNWQPWKPGKIPTEVEDKSIRRVGQEASLSLNSSFRDPLKDDHLQARLQQPAASPEIGHFLTVHIPNAPSDKIKRPWTKGHCVQGVQMGSLRVWRRKETEGRGCKVDVAFGLEEGVADFAELVGDEGNFLDVDADVRWGTSLTKRTNSRVWTRGRCVQGVQMGGLRVWRRKETEGRGCKVEVAFGLEEGVADFAEVVGDQVDSLDFDADGGVAHWAEDGEMGEGGSMKVGRSWQWRSGNRKEPSSRFHGPRNVLFDKCGDIS